MDGGKIVGWPLKRHIVSSGALVLAKTLFRLPVKDSLSGFAIYKREILERLNGKLSLIGYKLLLEVLVKTPGDVEVKEVPITFTNRLNGDSKLGFDQIYHYLKLCYRLKRYN
jgi:dolichol-phosphate mannosyltransferase